MRAVIQAFSKGQCGSHYLIADVEKVEGLKSWEGTAREFQHSSSQLDVCKQGLGPYVERNFLQRGVADTRGKMRPDMMRSEMTMAEQQQYLRHDDNSGSRLTALTPVMPDVNPRT